MPVFIEKPAFNLREKLIELDYSKVPYNKMPKGTIIQVTQDTQKGNRTATDSTSWVTTALEAKITPMFRSSRVLVMFSSSANSNNTNGHQCYYTLFRSINGATHTELVTTTGNVGFGNIRSASARVEGPLDVTFLDTPATTKEISYKVYFRSSSNSSTVEIPSATNEISRHLCMEVAA